MTDERDGTHQPGELCKRPVECLACREFLWGGDQPLFPKPTLPVKACAALGHPLTVVTGVGGVVMCRCGSDADVLHPGVPVREPATSRTLPAPTLEDAMEYPDHEEVTVQIASALRRMTEEGGGHNFLIVEVGRCHYVQFATSCGSAVLYGEASSGRYCTPGCTCPPTAAQQALLRSLGWRPPTRRKFLNFYRWWPLITERYRHAIDETAVATLRVFGWRGEPLQVKFHLDW